MKKFILVLILVLLTPSAYAADAIGKILAIKGSVQAVSADGSVRKNLKLSSPVYENETIITSAGAKLQVVFNDKSLFTVGENAEVILDKYAYDPTTGSGTSIIEVTKGIFKFLTGKIAKNDYTKVKINTPFATIGVRGSGGIINVGPTGQTTLNMTQCCLNIGARGSESPPVQLVQVNTFSNVSANGEVSQPKPAPISMLIHLNGAISLDGVEKANDSAPTTEGEKSAKKPIKALIQEKQKSESKPAEGQLSKDDANQPSLTKNDQFTGGGSLLSAFGSGADDEGGFVDQFGSGDSTSSADPAAGAAPTVNTTESQQQTLATTTFSGGAGGLENFGEVLSGNWENRDNLNVLIENGTMNAVIDIANNKIIFERLDSGDSSVIERVVFDAPSKGEALTINSADFGDMYIFRGLNDNFIHATNNIGVSGDNYEFIAGTTGTVTTSNQRVAGDRLFFKFLPDNELGANQFTNFNLAQGVPFPGVTLNNTSSNPEFIIDYTNGNNQFLGGHVDVYNGTGIINFKFMAGKMLTTGAEAMNGSAYSFQYNSNTSTFSRDFGGLSSDETTIYSGTDGSVDAYELNLALTSGGTNNIHAINVETTHATVNPINGAQLLGYSAGYIVRDIFGTPAAIRVGSSNLNDIIINRQSFAGIDATIDATFVYSDIAATGTIGTTALVLGFGGPTKDQAYISHNIYGAENGGPTTTTAGVLLSTVTQTDAAMLSSYFVDTSAVPIPETCKDCQFLTWGVWAGTIDIDDGTTIAGQIVPFVVGDNSQISTWATLDGLLDNATTVDATYRGILVGATSNGTTVNNDIGFYNANVDFGTRMIGFTGNFGDYTFGSAAQVVTGASAGQNTFTNVAIDNVTYQGAAVTGNANISGAFYGAGAENMGGNFNFNDTTNATTGAGIFAGKKQP